MCDVTIAHAVRCDALHKRYGDVVAVDGLSLDVERGECFGLLGPNGAGKTTTIEILEGLLAPDAGEVEVLGLTWARDEYELRQRLGIQLQESRSGCSRSECPYAARLPPSAWSRSWARWRLAPSGCSLPPASAPSRRFR